VPSRAVQGVVGLDIAADITGALAELGLIDDYEFVVHPRVAVHGPKLFAGISKLVDLKPVSQLAFASGAAALRYEPRRLRRLQE
jgi:hypothetical protein